MKTSWKTELPMWVLLAGMFVLAAVTRSSAPDRIPIHWNVRGEVDGYGAKTLGLLLLPLGAVAMYLLMLFMPRIDPGRGNYPKFWREYSVIRFGVVALMTAVYGIIHASIRGIAIRVETAIPVIIGLMFVLFGLISPKIKPNWFIGIRTPWTLSSRKSWEKTHFLGGWMLVLSGVLMAFLAIILPAGAAPFVLLAALLPVLITIAYSYFVWRDDEDKEPAISSATAAKT